MTKILAFSIYLFIASLTLAQSLVVGVGADNYRTDERANVGMFPVNANIYETLAYLNPDYSLTPMLAESWEFIEPNTWRFFLRREVTLHSGDSFSARDVKYSIDRLVAARPGLGNLGTDSVVVIDDFTIDITPERPNRRLIQQIAHPNWSIMAEGADPVTNPIGTGPFIYDEYRPEQHIRVSRNDNYWGKPAQVESITFRFIPDPNTRVLALQAGEIDIAAEVPREQTDDVANYPNLSIARSPVGAYSALYINISGNEGFELGGDPSIRRALALAVDKELIVNDMWVGNAEVNSSMIPQRILGNNQDLVQGVPFDPEAAAQLLDEAGWLLNSRSGIREKDGRPLSLSLIVGYPTAEIHRPMPEILQALWAEIGIDLRIETTPDTVSYEARLEEGTGDIWVEIGNQNDGNPCFLPQGLFYSQSNWGGYPTLFAPGEPLDQHIERCLEAVTPDEVTEAAALAMQVMIDQENVVIPVAGIYRIWAHRDGVSNFNPHPSGVNQRWNTITIN